MNTLVSVSPNQLTMSSREMADLVEKRHDSVKRTVDTLVNRGVISQPQIVDGPKSANGVHEKQYLIGRRDTYVVVAQLCPEFTARLVDRWQELEQVVAVPQSLSAALRLAADQAELIEQQQAALALAAPKAAFVDQYVECTGSLSFRQVAKLLGANERQFRQLLLDKGVLYYLGGVLTPYSQHQEAGRFEVKTGTSETNGHAFSQSRFTAKGVQWVAGLWAAYQIEVAA